MGQRSHELFIFLYGPPAAGKSAVGKRLAHELRLPFYDLDAEIELQAGQTIAEIFAAQGEPGFRQRETHGLQALLARSPGVIALGGGALLDPANRQRAEAAGEVVCLACSFETILDRLGGAGGGRPLLDGNARARLQDLLVQREGHYASFPRRVDSSRRRVAETAWEAQVSLGMFHIAGMGAGYDVRVGARGLADLGAQLIQRGLAGPAALVSDENVARLHGEAALAALQSAGFAAELIALPAGEQHKTLATVASLLERFVALGLERGSTVVALGGGVVGDLAGFVAASYLRGVALYQVPTSLLAMVDASVGGKTGLDLPEGKNLVGAFWQPRAVIADVATLRTLPQSEFRQGTVEAFKHGLLAAPDLLDAFGPGWLPQAPVERLREVVARSVEVKAAVVAADEREAGVRAHLNLGHTLAHALEAASGHALAHGDAVGYGLVFASLLARARGHADLVDLTTRFLRWLAPAPLPRADLATLRRFMARDKKVAAGRLRMVLLEDVGRPVVVSDVTDAELAAAWSELEASA